LNSDGTQDFTYNQGLWTRNHDIFDVRAGYDIWQTTPFIRGKIPGPWFTSINSIQVFDDNLYFGADNIYYQYINPLSYLHGDHFTMWGDPGLVTNRRGINVMSLQDPYTSQFSGDYALSGWTFTTAERNILYEWSDLGRSNKI
jgi:hypothetical protein